MDERQGTTHEPGAAGQGMTALAVLGAAVLIIVAGGVVGVWMGMRGEGHAMMWGGASTSRTAGFQLDGLAPGVVDQYGFAEANGDLYAQIPCFCGCEAMLGHRNLEDCFVTPEGTWESHAAGCQVCIDESRMLMQMMGRGMGPTMMRERIVAAFGGPIGAGP